MSIPYRARRNLRRFLMTVLALFLFLSLALLCWLLWLNRYVIYTDEGAKLDFGLSVQYAPGVVPVEPEPYPTVTVYDKTEDPQDPDTPVSNELQQFSGYYVTLDRLKENFDTVRDQLAALQEGSTVMLELKDPGSYVYYTSEVAEEEPDFDIARMDQLLAALREKGHYVIARIPAFQEREYILADERERFEYGLEYYKGGSLWWDAEFSCYWMNPANDGTLAYLIQLVTELRNMGFDEVVFSDFRFPRTEKIRFEGDKTEALTDAAAVLVKACATDTFCVSFTRATADLELPEGRTRLYLTDVSAADADTAAENSGLANPQAQVVFLTEMSDTRYEAFSVLRPLDTAH